MSFLKHTLIDFLSPYHVCNWSFDSFYRVVQVKLSSPPTALITIICAYFFSLGVIAPGIPVCSITTRYNLYIGRVCGKKQSYFWGVFAPWIIGCLFCQGDVRQATPLFLRQPLLSRHIIVFFTSDVFMNAEICQSAELVKSAVQRSDQLHRPDPALLPSHQATRTCHRTR